MSKQPNFSFSECQVLREQVVDILKIATQKGATSAEIIASINTGLDVGVRLGEIDKVEFNRNKAMSIVVYFGQQRGSASTSDTTADAIERTVSAACDIAKVTMEDEYSGLADADEMAYDYPDLDLYHPWDLDAQQAIALAKECETYGREFDKRICNSDGASVNTYSGYRVYANTHGFVGDGRSTSYDMSCVLVAKSNGTMQRDYEYTTARLQKNLATPQHVGEQAAQRTLARLNAKPIKTGQYPVIFAAPVASGLISAFISAISGGYLYRKASFLLDTINQKLFPSFININEQPYILQGLGSASFDNEGVRTRDKAIVTDGVLQTYMLGSYSARRLGLKTTGNSGGVHNVRVTTSDQDFNALLKAMDKGLVVTELMGQGINLVTGDYSRGVAGFLVENGTIQHSVEEITIAGNLRDMFKGIQAIGNDVDIRKNIQVGSIWIDRMMVAGV